MDIFALSEKLMRMDGNSWARHANPISVWSRIFGGSAVFLAIWSYHWFGWFAVIFIVAAALWIYINPRLFSPPVNVTSWSVKGVLGERIFLNRKRVPISRGHIRAAWITTSLAGPFVGLSIYGFIISDFWVACGGWHAATMAKLWYCDRMVWLWNDMQDADPAYQAWGRGDLTVEIR